MIKLNEPIITADTILAMEDMTFFTNALIFDNLLIVSQRETSCFVLNTGNGLIIIDAIWPAFEAFNAIISAIRDVGWNPAEIKKLIITHGHTDHTGCGKWLKENFNVKTYLSKTDDIFWRNNPTKPTEPKTWKDYDIDEYVSDGDIINLGNTSVYVYETPGHTPGCLSYIFPVAENDNVYMAALWGGATPPCELNGTRKYIESLDYFIEKAEKHNVSVALSNHTAIDNGLERIEYSKKRMSYMPNIYILGANGFLKYCQVYRNLSYSMLKRLKG